MLVGNLFLFLLINVMDFEGGKNWKQKTKIKQNPSNQSNTSHTHTLTHSHSDKRHRHIQNTMHT